MSRIEKSNLDLYPEAARVAQGALEHAATTALRGRDHSIGDALHIVPERHAVFRGALEGRQAAFRLALSEASREDLAREWGELTRAWEHMSAPPLTTPKPLAFSDAEGLMVTARASGEGLLSHLWRIEAAERAPLIALSADWLRKYTAPTEELRAPNRRPWRRWAEEAAARQPHEALREAEARVLQKMKKLYRQIDLPEWRVVLAHGDFHLNNLFWDGKTLTGIDLGGTGHAPLYKDIARALVHMARRGMLPSGKRRFGVDEEAFEAYAETFSLSETETNGFLPYFIAYETLIKVEHPEMPRARLDHAQEMTEALFADLKAIT
ncbi:hypothetical protein DZK27_00200 [Rhodobacteraceae bacterium 63075]|nr:hypothetical protein DZK27_00200 [Rhodobacteraceae bacterium 63075]